MTNDDSLCIMAKLQEDDEGDIFLDSNREELNMYIDREMMNGKRIDENRSLTNQQTKGWTELRCAYFFYDACSILFTHFLCAGCAVVLQSTLIFVAHSFELQVSPSVVRVCFMSILGGLPCATIFYLV